MLPFVPVFGFFAMMKDGELEKIGTPSIVLSAFAQSGYFFTSFILFMYLFVR